MVAVGQSQLLPAFCCALELAFVRAFTSRRIIANFWRLHLAFLLCLATPLRRAPLNLLQHGLECRVRLLVEVLLQEVHRGVSYAVVSFAKLIAATILATTHTGVPVL